MSLSGECGSHRAIVRKGIATPPGHRPVPRGLPEVELKLDTATRAEGLRRLIVRHLAKQGHQFVGNLAHVRLLIQDGVEGEPGNHG